MDDLQELKQHSERISAPSHEELRAMRRRIVDGITNPQHGNRPLRWLHRLPGRIVVPVVAGVLTVGPVLGVVLVRAATSPDDSVLLQAAAELDNRADTMTIPTADQWRYVKEFTRDYFDDTKYEREIWMRADYGRYAEYKQDGNLDTQTNDGRPYEELDGEFSTMGQLATFLQDLPDDPDAALERIHAIADEHQIRAEVDCQTPEVCEEISNTSWDRDGGAYRVLHSLLQISVPSADVQAKLFRALDRIPGTYDVGTIRDATDNEVHVVGWKPPDSIENTPDLAWTRNSQILIDTDTNTYRGFRYVDLFFKGDVADGVMLEVLYLDRAIVNQPGQRP